MTEGMLSKSKAEVDEEAAVWIWRLDSEAVTEETRTEFEAWLGKDPRHPMAYSALSEAWTTLDRLAMASEVNAISPCEK